MSRITKQIVICDFCGKTSEHEDAIDCHYTKRYHPEGWRRGPFRGTTNCIDICLECDLPYREEEKEWRNTHVKWYQKKPKQPEDPLYNKFV